MERHTGLLIIGVGLAVVVVGALVWAGAFSWFGRLPGDIRYEGRNTHVFVPITSSILISVVLTVVVNVVARLLR